MGVETILNPNTAFQRHRSGLSHPRLCFPRLARWETADPAARGFLGQVAPRPAEEPRLLAALLGARTYTGEGPGLVTTLSWGSRRGNVLRQRCLPSAFTAGRQSTGAR